MRLNPLGLVLRDFRPLVLGGSKWQKSQLRQIAERGQFALVGVHSSRYSRADCAPPVPFRSHSLCQRLWTRSILFTITTSGTFVSPIRCVVYMFYVLFRVD